MLNFDNTNFYSKPFEYFTGNSAIDQNLSIQVLDWFEADAPWHYVETDFYEQYEFDLLNVQVPDNLSSLSSKSVLETLKKDVERLFRVELSKQIDITAHKLIAEHRIRLHNDFVPNQETHRILIQFNRGWNADNGGLLMLFNSSEPSDVHKIILPEHNSVLGFAISPHSNHAVSTVHQGERFTLVYSFYQQ